MLQGMEEHMVQDKIGGEREGAFPRQGKAENQERGDSQGGWHFRQYRIQSGEFNTAMVHLYRGEITRANTWRTRLDATTNWAVVTTAGALSFAFSGQESPHFIIPLTTILVSLFLFIEARRYRYYELWSYRIRLMETEFFAHMLVPPFAPSEAWATRLANSLLNPRFTITLWEALGRRFRRNYQHIFIVLAVAWVMKIALQPTPVGTWWEFFERAAVGPVPGYVVVLVGVLFNAFFFAVGLLTMGLTQATGEVLQREELLAPFRLVEQVGHLAAELLEDSVGGLWRRHDQLAYVITEKGDEVAEAILKRLGRGVTALQGKGMYTGKDRAVLLVAIHGDQAEDLKRLVYRIDRNAFVVINPTEAVIGRGFQAPS